MRIGFLIVGGLGEHRGGIADLHWRRLDIENILEGAPVEKPDLSKVDEIGFTDLMRGGPGAGWQQHGVFARGLD